MFNRYGSIKGERLSREGLCRKIDTMENVITKVALYVYSFVAANLLFLGSDGVEKEVLPRWKRKNTGDRDSNVEKQA